MTKTTHEPTRYFHIIVKAGARIYDTAEDTTSVVKRDYNAVAVHGRYGIWYFRSRGHNYSVDYTDVTVEKEVTDTAQPE
jgi:hypothetical protein